MCMIKDKFALETDDLGNKFRQFTDGHVHTETNVDERRVLHPEQWRQGGIIKFHERDAGVGQIVAVKEFAERTPRAPDFHRGGIVNLALVHLPDKRREDMGAAGLVIVSGAEKVGRHDCEIMRPVLTVERPT